MTGAQTAEYYHAKGYRGIIVTDHFFNGNCAVSPELPWKERVERFFEGYRDAKEAGEKLGLTVLYGWEYNYQTTEFLTYGADIAWLTDHPDILTLSPEEYCDEIHRAGGLIVHAHPFRERPYIRYFRLFPNYVDAVETVNAAHHLFPDFDKRADFYADSYRLKKVVGSDFHYEWPGGLCAMEFEEPIAGIHDFIRLVSEGKYSGLRLDTEGRVIARLL